MSMNIPAGLRNGWLRQGPLEVYVRIRERVLDGQRRSVFEVANVQVSEKRRRQGIFTSWFNGLHLELARRPDLPKVLFVEGICNDWLKKRLEKQGFKRQLGTDPDEVNMWKEVSACSGII